MYNRSSDKKYYIYIYIISIYVSTYPSISIYLSIYLYASLPRNVMIRLTKPHSEDRATKCFYHPLLTNEKRSYGAECSKHHPSKMLEVSGIEL